MTFKDNLDGTATLSGTPTVFGFFNLSIIAQNGFGTNAQQTFVLRINATLTVAQPPDLQAGAAYNQAFIASGGTAPYSLVVQSGTVPPGTTLSASGVLTGTATATGAFSFTLAVSDSTLPANAGPFAAVFNFTLNVTPPTLVISPNALMATNKGAVYSQKLTGLGGTPPYTLSIGTGTPPPGIAMDANGVFTGSAAAEGMFAFTVTAIDSTGGNGPYSLTMPYSIFVNHAPVIISGPTAQPSFTQPGMPVQFSATATDADAGDTLSYLWNFIDGTTSSLPNPTHVFTTSGTHAVNLTVTDHHGGQANGSMQVVVQDISAAGLDSDGDGYSDEIETALGSNPNDPASTPFNLPAITKKAAIGGAKLAINLSFVTIFNDSIVLTGTLPLPASFAPSGQTVIVDVVGVVSKYTLQSTGKSAKSNTNAANFFSLQQSTQSGRNGAFFLAMKRGNFSASLASSGMTDLPANNAALSVPITIIVNNTVFCIRAPQQYSTFNFQSGASTSP